MPSSLALFAAFSTHSHTQCRCAVSALQVDTLTGELAVCCRLRVLCGSVRQQTAVPAAGASGQPGRLGVESATLWRLGQLRRRAGRVVRSDGRQRRRSRHQLVRAGRHSETRHSSSSRQLVGRRAACAQHAAPTCSPHLAHARSQIVQRFYIGSNGLKNRRRRGVRFSQRSKFNVHSERHA